jgi:hypothetical protein
MNRRRLQPRINSGSVQVEEMELELEIILVSSVMEREPARLLVVHGDVIHTHR